MARNERQERPILNIQRSPIELALEVLAAIGVLAGIIIVAQSWSSLPDIIPIHFGITGKPDNWGSKGTMWLFPALCLLLDVAFIFLSNFPHTYNYPVPITQENAARQYQIARWLLLSMKIEMIWMFALIDWQIIQAAVRNAEGLSVGWIFAIQAIIFGTVGLYLWQAYRDR